MRPVVASYIIYLLSQGVHLTHDCLEDLHVHLWGVAHGVPRLMLELLVQRFRGCRSAVYIKPICGDSRVVIPPLVPLLFPLGMVLQIVVSAGAAHIRASRSLSRASMRVCGVPILVVRVVTISKRCCSSAWVLGVWWASPITELVCMGRGKPCAGSV